MQSWRAEAGSTLRRQSIPAELRIAAESTGTSRDRLLIYDGPILALHKCELIYHPVLLVT